MYINVIICNSVVIVQMMQTPVSRNAHVYVEYLSLQIIVVKSFMMTLKIIWLGLVINLVVQVMSLCEKTDTM